MKQLSLLSLIFIGVSGLHAGWLDFLFGSKEEEATPAASSMDLSSATSMFSDGIIDFATNSGDGLLKSLGGDLTAQVSSLAGLLGQDPDAAAKLTGALSALQGEISTTNWTDMLTGFSGLASGQLGEKEQASLTKTMELATAFGLQTFFKDTPYYDDVSTAITSLQAGKYVSAVPALQNVLNASGITSDQQALIDSSVGYFGELAKAKGVDMLKDGIGSFLGGQG